MACFRPLDAVRGMESPPHHPAGRILFRKSSPIFWAMNPDRRLKLPCGQCVGCRLEYSRTWAIRCEHETTLHDQNCFITLTFNDEHLERRLSESICKRDMQLFIKRLRDRVGYGRVRHYYCGEYGALHMRPHYHAILFNYDFEDKYPWTINKAGDVLYRSPLLEQLWPFGHCLVGAATWSSAAYVARYILKKQTVTAGTPAEKVASIEARYVSPRTGQILEPEFVDMSRRPGIGRDFYRKFTSDMYPEGAVVSRAGKLFRTPRYYDNLYEIEYPEEMAALRARRSEFAIRHQAESTPERLAAREEVTKERISRLFRPLEE